MLTQEDIKKVQTGTAEEKKEAIKQLVEDARKDAVMMTAEAKVRHKLPVTHTMSLMLQLEATRITAPATYALAELILHGTTNFDGLTQIYKERYGKEEVRVPDHD